MNSVEEKISEIDQTILPWLGRAVKALDFFISDNFTSHQLDLTKAQMILLRRLVANDGVSQHDLAFITNRDKASLTRLVNTMEKKGYVTRKHSAEDKRINHVFISALGRETLAKAFPIMRETIKIVQKDISPTDIQTTIKVLQKISNNINADELTAPLTYIKQ